MILKDGLLLINDELVKKDILIEDGIITKIEDEIEGEEIFENSLARDSGQIVEEVLAYIVQHIFERDLNVENIASHFHFHPVYLNRIFKKQKDDKEELPLY